MPSLSQKPRLPACVTAMSASCIRQTDIRKTLLNLDANKANGPDGILAIVLKTCAFLRTGRVPY